MSGSVTETGSEPAAPSASEVLTPAPPKCGCGCGETIQWDRKRRAWYRFRQYHHLRVPEIRAKWGASHRALGLTERADYVFLHPDLNRTPSLAYLFGALKGDGHVGKQKNGWLIAFQVVDREFFDAVVEALRKIGLHPSGRRVRIRPTESPLWRLDAHSKAFSNWYHGQDIVAFLGGQRELEAAFLRGLFDAEGNYYDGVGLLHGNPHRRTRTRIAMGDAEIVRIAHDTLIGWGLHPHLSSRPPKRQGWRTMYQVELSRIGEVRAFLEEICPTIPRKKWSSQVRQKKRSGEQQGAESEDTVEGEPDCLAVPTKRSPEHDDRGHDEQQQERVRAVES